MSASHVMETDICVVADRECWVCSTRNWGAIAGIVSDRPSSFAIKTRRQEQAAAQLGRCPLGTVQSRLARGRAKLKALLEKRGLELSAFGGVGHVAQQVGSPPPAWGRGDHYDSHWIQLAEARQPPPARWLRRRTWPRRPYEA